MTLQKIVSILATGLICGLIAAMFSISSAALLFSSALGDHIVAAIGICLFGTAVLSAVIALASSYPGMVSASQEVSVVVFAVIAASIDTALSTVRSEEDILATVIVMIGVGTIFSGLALLAMGVCRLGRLIRFIPFPVIAGFLAGMGWLILMGALAVVLGEPLTLRGLSSLLAFENLTKWGPAAMLAITIDTLSRREGSRFIVPITIVSVLCTFHVGVWMLDLSTAQLQHTGWLFQPTPGDRFPMPLEGNPLAAADWQVIIREVPKIIVLITITATSVLFASSGIELSIQRDIDLDRELRAAGLANIFAGAGGGAAGFQGLGMTLLAHHLNAPSRIVGLLVAAICTVILFFGANLLSFIPVPVVGGLLGWVGWSLLRDWLFSIYAKVSWREYAIILLIVVLVVTSGPLKGVLAGTCAAAVLFAIEYSRVDVVKYALTGECFHSDVAHDEIDRAYLNAQGQRILVLRLQGFIFFATIHRLHQYVSARLAQTDAPKLGFLVLDCRDVTGFDSSAALGVARICEMVGKNNGSVIVSNLNRDIDTRLCAVTQAAGDGSRLRYVDDVGRAIELCEGGLLQDWADRPRPQASNTINEQLARNFDHPDAFWIMESYLERLNLEPNAKLMAQGDLSCGIFFIENGQVVVETQTPGQDPIYLRTLGSGSIVGEVSFLLERPSTTTATAQVQTIVWRLSEHGLRRLSKEEPGIAYSLHQYLLRNLAERLNQTNRLVQSLTD